VWQAVGSDGDLLKAGATALMYPGRKFGLEGPAASLRMKAWRDGLQTAELLRMLRARMKWNDSQLRAWVAHLCGLEGWRDAQDPKADAGIVTFATVTAAQLAALQQAALRQLTQGQ
jgi:hypothetical protein